MQTTYCTLTAQGLTHFKLIPMLQANSTQVRRGRSSKRAATH